MGENRRADTDRLIDLLRAFAGRLALAAILLRGAPGSLGGRWAGAKPVKRPAEKRKDSTAEPENQRTLL